jgi:DNA polymerase (family 10)
MDSAEAASAASAAPAKRISHPRRKSPSAGQSSLLALAASRRFANAHQLERWLRRYSRDGEAARARGYEYVAITDHSKGLSIANGINEAKLKKQSAEIDAVNRELRACDKDLTVLRSIEMNLNPVGEGDMDPTALRSLDLVLGSFHSALRRKEDQTDRYLAAIRNPDIQILGHPRGRIYNYRSGLRADWETVFQEATRLDKAVEIDAYPDRQDLNLSLLKIAKRCGTRISMGTDAHHPWQFEFIDLALVAALTAKIPPERIVNFMPITELCAWVENVRRAEARRRHGSGKRRLR